ncbi:MAG TPA: transporter, partial [Thermoanaerobaculia bacterium]|nr:transporter [Thermoanaerobaculia bacterium]
QGSGLEEPVNPDRPDFTNGPSLVAPGHFQLETGYTYSRSGPERTSALGEILVRYAFDDRWEARLGLNSYDWIDTGVPGERRVSGFEDPFAEVKIRFNDADAKHRAPGVPAMGLLVQTTVPAGSRALTSDVWQPRATFALHWDLPADWSLESNLGYSYAADGSQRFDQFFASASAGFQLNEKVGGFLEGYGFTKESADGSTTHYLDAGLTYLVSKDLQLDVRVGKGLESPHPNWFTGFGAGIRW